MRSKRAKYPDDQSHLHEGDVNTAQKSTTGHHQTYCDTDLEIDKSKTTCKLSWSESGCPIQHALPNMLRGTQAPKLEQLNDSSVYLALLPKGSFEDSSVPGVPKGDRTRREKNMPHFAMQRLWLI